MNGAQAYEYLGAMAVVASAFFLFLQVAIFGDAGKGWIDRPWYIRLPMSLVAGSLCFKAYSWFWLGEHFTHGGAIVAICIACWQFTSVFYAVTQSYKMRAEEITKVLFDHHPVWGQTEPEFALLPHEIGKGVGVMFHGRERQNAQIIESRKRQNDRRSKSS